MDPKPRPNHQKYLEVLRSMTGQQRIQKAFEMSAFTKQLFIAGLRQRHPDLDEAAFHALLLEKLAQCHNRNY